MEPILYALQDGVATITLNRPEVMNALSSALRRRFNTVVLPLPSSTEEEVAIVTKRVAELGSGLMRLADWQVRNEWRQRIAMLNAALTQGREALDARLAARGVRDGGGEPG